MEEKYFDIRNKQAANFFGIVLLVVLTTLAYSNSFQGEFTLDDFVNILNSPDITTFKPTLDGIIDAATDEPNGRRWLPNLSFAVNHFIHGEDVWGYHLVNLLVHIAASIVFFLLCRVTLNLPRLKDQFAAKNEVAIFAALLWAVHPLQTNSVTYIVQRMNSMSALFCLLSLFMYVNCRLGGQSGLKKVLLASGSLVFLFMAVVSKENALIFPVIILAYELYFLSEEDSFKQYRKTGLLAAVVVAAVCLFCMLFLGKDLLTSVLGGYNHRDFTMGQRLLTESRVFFFYLSLIFLPLPSRLNINHDIVVSQGILSPPQTLAAILGIIFLVALIPFLFNRNRLLSFGLLWFMGNLVIESTIIPLEIIFEHRLYLPTTFLFLGLIATVFNLFCNRRTTCRAVAILTVCLLSFWTWQRNQVWASNFTLWSDALAKSPRSERAHINLATVYHDRQQFREAEQLFLRAISLAPEDRQAYVSLGSLYLDWNRYAEAMQMLQDGLARQAYLNPSRIYHYLGVLYRKAGRYAEAVTMAKKALRQNPEDREPIITIGIAYTYLQEYQKADGYFSQAETLGMKNTNLYNNWGVACFKMGQVDRAIGYLRKALEIDPYHPESHYNLGVAYGAKGMIEEARNEMRRSMELRQR